MPDTKTEKNITPSKKHTMKTQKHSSNGDSNSASDDTKPLKINRETMNKILDMLKKYIKLDKTFRLKHESLKTLYNAYLDLYKKTKCNTEPCEKESVNESSVIDPANLGNANVQSVSESVSASGDKTNDNLSILKNIHSEMRDNNSNLYRERLLILKKIKETPDIDHQTKNKICRRLIAIFKSPPVPDYKPLQLLITGSGPVPSMNNIENMIKKIEGMSGDVMQRDVNPGNEMIKISELDDAYLQKHNELMTVYKAYQNLYNKVLNYKDELDQYRRLPTGSSISRDQMDKLLKDQKFVMDMIDKMQDNLVSKKVIDESEKVPVSPVVSHPKNIESFNNTMRDQIKHIINRRIEINDNTKNKIDNLLKQYKSCDSNDKFCKSGKQLLLLKKLN